MQKDSELEPIPIENCDVPIDGRAMCFCPKPTSAAPNGGFWAECYRRFKDVWFVNPSHDVCHPSHYLPLLPTPPCVAKERPAPAQLDRPAYPRPILPIQVCDVPVGHFALCFYPVPSKSEPDSGFWVDSARRHDGAWQTFEGRVFKPTHYLPSPPFPAEVKSKAAFN